MTKREAAASVLWTESKLSRIETGATTAAPADVRLLLIQYGVEEARVKEAVEFAKAARRPDEWAGYREAYTNSALSLFSQEGSASLILKFEPSLVPGLFQTEEYARAVLKDLGTDPKVIDLKLRGRMRRQEILDDERGPELNFIIGEAAISRPVGGRKVMLAQIDRLTQLATLNRVNLQVIPFSVGVYPGLGSAFTVLEFDESDLQDLVYLEDVDKESIVRDDQAAVDLYTRRFAELSEIATSVVDLPDGLQGLVGNRFDQ